MKHQEKAIREEISKILVKWSMPTRQVAINELLTLIAQVREETIEEVEANLRDRVMYIGEEIPDAVAEDKRTKTVYLGFPAEHLRLKRVEREEE